MSAPVSKSALTLVRDLYPGKTLGTGEDVWNHALGMALIAASLKLDADTRLAARCCSFGAAGNGRRPGICRSHFDVHGPTCRWLEKAQRIAGPDADHPHLRSAWKFAPQTETLRKMLLGLVEDIRW